MIDAARDARERLDRAVSDQFGEVVWSPTLETIASPSWVGADSLFFEGSAPDGEPLLARVLQPAAMIRVDTAAMFTAMTAAASAGLAPRLLFHDAAAGVCVQERLGEEWHVGTLYRFHVDPAAWRASLEARRRFRELAVDLPVVNVFDQVAALRDHVEKHAIEVPSPVDELVGLVQEARGIVSPGLDPVPCHGDAASSNVMMKDGDVRLVGWTQAACMDPLEEIGSILTEFAPMIASPQEAFAAAWGRHDPVALARAQLFGLADDVRWGLIGSIARATEPDSPVEYQRYGHWRLFKARFAVASGESERWMREAS